MVRSSFSSPSSFGRLTTATLALIVSACLSVLHINISGQAISLTWLPLLVILLWPNNILSIWSVVIFLIVGLFVDWASAGAPGQWALIYLICLAVLNPAFRNAELTLSGVIRNWLVIIFISVVAFTISGWFIYGRLPEFAIMARQALLVTAILPLYYLIRRAKRAIFGDPAERD